MLAKPRFSLMPSWAASLLAAVLFLTAGALAHAAGLEKLTIRTGQGSQTFEVEVMRNDAERAKGLMFRRNLPADRGMLFDFARDEPVSMWMQNTYIPLDMLFIRKDGSIASIAENTEPLSTRTISSGEPVRAVLEVNAGTAAKLGIKPGDRVEHAMFGKR